MLGSESLTPARAKLFRFGPRGTCRGISRAGYSRTMAQYMLMVYEEEAGPAEREERERELPLFVQLHRSLRAAGLLVGVKALRSTEAATSVRVRAGETEITDG